VAAIKAAKDKPINIERRDNCFMLRSLKLKKLTLENSLRLPDY